MHLHAALTACHGRDRACQGRRRHHEGEGASCPPPRDHNTGVRQEAEKYSGECESRDAILEHCAKKHIMVVLLGVQERAARAMDNAHHEEADLRHTRAVDRIERVLSRLVS